jgi:methylmalonyl-CoA carboxyltransferase 12S subunit
MTETIAADSTRAIEELRAEIRRLAQRVEELESARTEAPAPPAVAVPERPPIPQAAPLPPVEEAISEEVLLVISAAVAAFLGERAHIRQIRLLRSPLWAQQGRVWIQASHTPRHHR